MTPPSRSQLEARLQELIALRTAARKAARRRSRTLALLAVISFALLGAVSVQNADLEIHPNVSGGNPNNSHLLELIGDGNSGADRAMSLSTVPTTDAEYRLAISDNGGTERFSFSDDGELGINDTTPSYALDVNGDARIGWHGDSSRIKLLPSDFLGNDDVSDGGWVAYEDDDTAKAVRSRSSGSLEIYAFATIPHGYEATHVRIYGTSIDTVNVYESDIDDGLWSASLGSAATGTEIDITDVASDSTNFLVIEIAINSSADDLFGGYITIQRE